MRIWLSAFAEFVSKSGASKVTSVSTTKSRAGQVFTRGTDYYCGMREACASSTPETVEELTAAAVEEASEKRRGHYGKVAHGFTKWLKSVREFESLGPVSGRWECGDLTVTVSPELHVVLNGEEYLIKLHFKNAPATRDEVLACTTLMRATLGNKVAPGCRMAVLDIRERRLHVEKRNTKNGLLLMEAEAAAFVSIWKQLPDVGGSASAA